VREDLVSFIDLAPTVLAIAGVDLPRHLQGQVFLGERPAPPRTHVFAARDRMDETYDIIRAARDRRFKYIRNFEPWRPYAQPIDYMDQMPTMREMRRLAAEGRLEGAARLFFRATKPDEELYDLEADPHEVRDLAGSPEHAAALERLRRALDAWMVESGDLGLLCEDVLAERQRPGGRWAETAAPEISPAGGSFAGPVEVRIACATEGASIACTTGEGEAARWRLYSGPLTVAQSATLRVKACRLGFRDSPEVKASFEIRRGS
jgi:hypothetical protein